MRFLHPQPSDEELREIYRCDYYLSLGITGADADAPKAMKQHTFRRQFESLGWQGEPGKILDVGCATGLFLEVAAGLGWQPYGVELSRFAAQKAQERFGDRISHGTLAQARYPEAFFDAVTLFDLLEHVREPGPFLGEVHRVLRPGGRLLLVMPDAASPSARLMGAHWPHYNAEHLHYFSPATVTRLLAACGFTVQRVEKAAKYLTLNYIFNQIRRYPRRLVSPLASCAAALLPDRAKALKLRLYCGEMLVVARSCPTSLPEASRES